MDKKLLLSVLFSTLLLSGIVGYAYASDETVDSDKGHGMKLEMRLTDEERAQRLEELESMTLEQWKQEQIDRINNFSEEDFERMKEGRKAFLENDGQGFSKGKRMDPPLSEE